MRIAHVAPVATTIPPPKSGSVETMTSLLTEGLVARGHHVTLFATGDSRTSATLHATYPHGYWHDENMWPWELYEMLNLAAAAPVRARFEFTDDDHYTAGKYAIGNYVAIGATDVDHIWGSDVAPDGVISLTYPAPLCLPGPRQVLPISLFPRMLEQYAARA